MGDVAPEPAGARTVSPGNVLGPAQDGAGRDPWLSHAARILHPRQSTAPTRRGAAGYGAAPDRAHRRWPGPTAVFRPSHPAPIGPILARLSSRARPDSRRRNAEARFHAAPSTLLHR